LELNDREQKNASRRHTEVREYLATKFIVERSFLTGSYARYTKTKPLKDVDIFFVLGKEEKHYRDKAPPIILEAFREKLVQQYGEKAVKTQGRSINVDFGVVADIDDNTDYRIISVDIVPAFESGSNYEIPDGEGGRWIKTNPEIHAEKATAAHRAYSNEWKGLVRMMKYWNNNPKHGADRPIKPNFLIEVMALDCLHGGWQGRFDYEVQALFATLAERIMDDWPDPAGLGPPISGAMDQLRKQRARELLRMATQETSIAINLSRQGQSADALKAWRSLFGPRFPLS
jgi:Second Messenger Oligonucleotide or Dinucleotide Synthetase domain